LFNDVKRFTGTFSLDDDQIGSVNSSFETCSCQSCSGAAELVRAFAEGLSAPGLCLVNVTEGADGYAKLEITHNGVTTPDFVDAARVVLEERSMLLLTIADLTYQRDDATAALYDARAEVRELEMELELEQGYLAELETSNVELVTRVAELEAIGLTVTTRGGLVAISAAGDVTIQGGVVEIVTPAETIEA
jgi:hypothetical protein